MTEIQEWTVERLKSQGYASPVKLDPGEVPAEYRAHDDYLLGRFPSTAGPQPAADRRAEEAAYQATQAEQLARREAREREMACMRDCRPPLSYEPRCHVPDCPWWAYQQEVHEAEAAQP